MESAPVAGTMSAHVHPGSERLSTSDWFTSNYALSTDAERGCKASHDVRQESRYLRNETDNKTYWDQVGETLQDACLYGNEL